jgi:acyl-CoA synthetase (AMP-forming)/AMP-acid ligase II
MSSSEKTIKASTLVELLQCRAIEQPESKGFCFLVDGETEELSLTYSELDRQARAIAAYIQSVCSVGDRVLLLYPPSLDYIAAFFGCLYAGTIAVPVYPPRPNRSFSRLQKIIENADAKAALTLSSTLESIERRFLDRNELNQLVWAATDAISPNSTQNWQEPKLKGEDIAFLQYTSGSTADPKGVVITHDNLLHNLGLIHGCFEHNSEKRGFIWLPPYHDMGLIGGVLQPLYAGFPVVLMSPLLFLQNPLRWLKGISKYRSTTSGGPNFAYDLCVRKFKPEQVTDLDLSSWEVAFNGAEPINYDTIEGFARTFAPYGFRAEAFYPCYGMAEATLIISGGKKAAPIKVKTLQADALTANLIVPASSDEPSSKEIVSCGNNLPEQKLLIVDPETRTNLPNGRVGEVWVAGKSIAKGYWQQPEETEKNFSAYVTDTGEGKFFRTGDLGFLDDGELYITGRIKDIIIINGRNHYPQDIERSIEQVNSSIRPNCVAAFSLNIAGEEKLVVVAEVDRHYWETTKQNHNNNQRNGKHPQISPRDLIQAMRRAVSENHELQLHAILLLKTGSIPKTSSGKIQRHACRNGFVTGTLEAYAIEDSRV